MRERKNPNYMEFSKTETVVQFARDRGELHQNSYGPFFFRELMDGRFTCANPDLERRLVDLGYTANQRVGITRETHNRNVIWKVRLIDAPQSIESARPAAAAVSRNIATRPAAPIPESKYAAPPAAWPEAETPAPAKPVARAAENRPATGSVAALDQICDQMEHCLTRSVDMMCAAQKRAVEQGCAISFLGADVQDLASTIYIQLGKQANINLMSRNDELRRAGGGDAWRH